MLWWCYNFYPLHQILKLGPLYRLRLGHKTSEPVCAHMCLKTSQLILTLFTQGGTRELPLPLYDQCIEFYGRNRAAVNQPISFQRTVASPSADPPRPPLGTFLTFITQFHSFRCKEVEESDSSDVVRSLICCPTLHYYIEFQISKVRNQNSGLNVWCKGWCLFSPLIRFTGLG